MNVSDKGLASIAAHEGRVLNAYLDPVGIVTIGYGFTNRSRIFLAWAKAKWGRKMRMGDRISLDEANDILRKLLVEEYEPPVERMFDNLTQPQFDACVSACYNLGAGCLKWRWAKALKAGDIKRAAALLRVTGTTANGRKLKGLVRRRNDEANMIEFGRYPSHQMANVKAEDDISDLQRDLKALGYKPGPIDGVLGTKTREATHAFQSDNPPLAVDGIAGPATRAAIARELKGKSPEIPTSVENAINSIPAASGFFHALIKIVMGLLK